MGLIYAKPPSYKERQGFSKIARKLAWHLSLNTWQSWRLGG
jgi:hypothetical protein